MIPILLMLSSWVPNPYPPEMIIEPEPVVVVQPVAAAPGTYRPIPYAPDDSHAGPDVPSGQLTEAEMTSLVGGYFPADRHAWALRVSWCESHWDTTAKNSSSGAAGLFQFLRSTWDWVSHETGTPSYDQGGVWDARLQMVNAVWLLENGGTSHWVCK